MTPPHLVLASASPRRRELLDNLGVPLTVLPSGADESLPPHLAVTAAIEAVALRKAEDVAGRVAPTDRVLAADTAGVIGDRVLGKPVDRADAEAMLHCLSGRTHQVITAVAFLGPETKKVFSVSTDVLFRPLTTAQITWYASLEEPHDKAGAYAIQGQGAFLVESISGSYTNVVGLPVAEVAELLEDAGLTPWQSTLPEEATGA